jgi:hypothetical protein
VTKSLGSIGYALVLIAALWAIGVSIYVFFSPQVIQEITATNVPGEPQVVEEFTTVTTWYKVQGLWGSILLVLFAGLYVLGAFLARRASYGFLAVLCVVALLLSYLAGLSIGLLYLPAALSMSLGTLFMYFVR